MSSALTPDQADSAALTSGEAPVRPGVEAPVATPSLLDTLSGSEQRIAAQLGELGSNDALRSEEARRQLELLLWVQRQAEELEDRKKRNEIERDHLRDRNRRLAAVGWLHVGNRAARSLLGAAAVILLILVLFGLWGSGQLDPSHIAPLLP